MNIYFLVGFPLGTFYPSSVGFGFRCLGCFRESR